MGNCRAELRHWQRVSGKVVSLTDYVRSSKSRKVSKDDSRERDELDKARQASIQAGRRRGRGSRDSGHRSTQKRISLDSSKPRKPWVLLEERYPIGAKVRGKVRNITNFGILWVLRTESMDWYTSATSAGRRRLRTHRNCSRKDEVEAMVLHIDPDMAIQLGIKQLESDPWEDIDRRFPIGNVIEGKASSFWTSAPSSWIL